ncbi:hypothetical protein AVEN_111366-1 [Araneus ventricosus]|uniref:Uncharacterized protein n=1 Tax=Araneus ventricosus TaxID=182803 RepID=A0A4Y2MME7_ARAVE|nr:hypothetical protein AVEN_111366-1 [Araneus ventricosus]
MSLWLLFNRAPEHRFHPTSVSMETELLAITNLGFPRLFSQLRGRRRIEAETPSQAQKPREIHGGKQRLHIERQPPAQSQTRREVNVTIHKNRVEAKTPAQTRRERDAAAHSRRVERQTLEPR